MRLAVCGFTALVLLALPAHAEMSGGKINPRHHFVPAARG